MIKTVHTLAWLSIESCVLYVLYAGLTGRTDKRAGIAGAIVAGETLVFAGNGFRCPLTELAERYGARRGPVTDIYLPKCFARNMPAIHTPLLALMTYLHARNLRWAKDRAVYRHESAHSSEPSRADGKPRVGAQSCGWLRAAMQKRLPSGPASATRSGSGG